MHNVYVNYIVEYYDKIERGQIIAGKWIKKIYKILVDGIKSGDWDFDAKKANKAIQFIENFCHHSKGRNDLFKLELWQKAIISAIFGILDKKTHRRQFREIFLLVGRKTGKAFLRLQLWHTWRISTENTAANYIALRRNWIRPISCTTVFTRSRKQKKNWQK